MPVSQDFYVHGQSWLHQADPRTKFLLVICAGLVLLLLKTLSLMLLAFAASLLLHRSAKLPAGKILFVLKALLPITVLMPILWVLFYPSGPALLELWILRVTWLSLLQGITVAARINAMTLVVFAVLYTTEQRALVRGLVKLRIPFEWGLVLSLALRYIPDFQNSFTLITQAQQARGLDLTSLRGFRRVRQMMPIFVPMVISSLRASEHLSNALEARAFGVRGVRRTVFRDIAYRRADLLLAGLILIITLAIVALHLQLGFGADTVHLLS